MLSSGRILHQTTRRIDARIVFSSRMQIQNYIIQLNVVLGIILLVSGIKPLWRICRMLPKSLLRSMWFALGLLIFVAVSGYVTFLYINSKEGFDHYEDLLTSAIFLISAVFTAVICRMSLSTAKDVSRIALLEYHARVDSLTDLFNRGYTMLLLQRACRSSARLKSPLSVLLLDMDNFKEINDTFGHQAGDNVLRQFAGLLTSLHSEPLFVGRYGGDEFIVVLPCMDMTKACLIADNIRRAVETHLLAAQTVPVTVSIGVATSLGLREVEAEQLLAEADKAMYRAKHGGRNQVARSRAHSRPMFSYSSIAAETEALSSATSSAASPLQLAD
jgi:diguanylate cyclase (GGDEF)-like protein